MGKIKLLQWPRQSMVDLVQIPSACILPLRLFERLVSETNLSIWHWERAEARFDLKRYFFVLYVKTFHKLILLRSVDWVLEVTHRNGSPFQAHHSLACVKFRGPNPLQSK